MAYNTTQPMSCKGALNFPSADNDLPTATSHRRQQITPNLLANIAAVALVSASAGFGALYAWQMGSDHGLAFALLAVVMALGLEIAKPLAVTGALEAFRSWSLVRGLALVLVAAVAVTYSLTAELSLMAGARGDKVAERVASNVVASNADADRTRLTIDLAAIGQTRPSAAINSQLQAILTDKRLQDCETWLESTRLRTRCIEIVAPLKAELATAEKKEKLEAELATLRTTANSSQVKADPAAHALATYLSALGFQVEANVLSEWLFLVPVLALEIGSAFAGLLAGGMAANTDLKPRSTTAPDKPAKAQETSVADSVQATVQTIPLRLAVSNVPAERLVQLLNQSGGEVLAGQRMLARALGVSTGAVNALLHDLASTGRVILEAGKGGTRVRLAAA